MDHENTFSYTYSAQKNQEVWNIRKLYLPQDEGKSAQPAGIGGALLFRRKVKNHRAVQSTHHHEKKR